MLKARIVTASLENAEPLAEQLRKRGCEVEIVRLGEATAGPVDLEFELESCPADRALDRAAELSRQRSADVYVAPGCFPEKGTRPATDARFAVEPAIIDERVFSETRQKQRNAMARALREKRVLIAQARAAQSKAEQGELPTPTIEAIPVRSEQQLDSQEEKIHAARTLDPMLARQWAQAVPTQGISPRSRELRVAFGVAAMVAALFMLGWSAVSRNTYPSTPASSPEAAAAQVVEPQTPASPVTIHSPQLVQSSAPHGTRAAAVSKSTRVSKPALLPSRHSGHLREGRSNEDGVIAEDEVRYLSRRAKPVQRPANPQHASLKRFSDMQ